MGKPVEYEFILKDGTKRYEIVYDRADVWHFKKILQAVSALPVRK